MRDSDYKECPDCHKVGRIRKPSSAAGWELCQTCGGSGFIYNVELPQRDDLPLRLLVEAMVAPLVGEIEDLKARVAELEGQLCQI